MRVSFCIIILITACSDASGPGASTTMSFNYAGSASGSFNADGDAVMGTVQSSVSWPRPATTFAVALHDTISGALSLVAQRSGTNQLDMVELHVVKPSNSGAGLNAGTFGFCPIEVTQTCLIGADVLLGGSATDAAAGQHWQLESGTLTVSSIAGGRIQGSFSGAMILRGPGSLIGLGPIIGNANMTSGTFNLPVEQRGVRLGCGPQDNHLC